MLKAGLIEDWNYGTNFRKIEWVERREWVYTKSFDVTQQAKHYILHFDGLDFNGFVFLNGKQILEFNQMHLRYSVEITDLLDKENTNNLKVVFLQSPEVDGQVGYTSKVNILKSRFNYGWDWCPRLVNVGIFGDVWVECCDQIRVTDFYPNTAVESGKGNVVAEIETESFTYDELGLMIWQEFPQSSSGIDNVPNEDPEFIENLKVVSNEFIIRARSHISLTYWCGGNELYYEHLYRCFCGCYSVSSGCTH